MDNRVDVKISSRDTRDIARFQPNQHGVIDFAYWLLQFDKPALLTSYIYDMGPAHIPSKIELISF